MNIPNNTGVYMIVNDTSRLKDGDTKIINTLPHGVLLAEKKHRNSYKNVQVIISEGEERTQVINYYNRIGIKIKGLIKIDLSTADHSRMSEIVHDNFDAEFYLTLYPDLRRAGVVTHEQARKHWLDHGRIEKRFCNKQSAWKDIDPKYKTPYYDNIKHKINKYISDNKFSKDKKLCVTLITTNKEIANGKLQRFTENFNRFLPSKTLRPDLYIFIDQELTAKNKNKLKSCKSMLNRHFNFKKIVNLNIDKFNNIYIHIPPPDYIQREYGRSSGPNIGFFRCMNYYNRFASRIYENILLLEWDTRPMKHYWYDSILESIKNKNFLIYGSQYKGHGLEQYMPWEGHINGVGVYNISNPWLSFLLEEAEKCLIHEIRGNYSRPPAGPGMVNYDVAIWYYIKNHQEFLPLVVNSSEFVNISLETDMHIKDQEIFSAHPECLIVHQKTL